MSNSEDALIASREYEKDMAPISRILKDRLDVEYFSYHSLSEKGDYRVLIDRLDWGEFYCEKDFFQKDCFLRHPEAFSHQDLFMGFEQLPVCKSDKKSIRENFSFDRYYGFIRKDVDRTHFYFFVTKPGISRCEQAFSQQRGLFDKFFNYFHQAAATPLAAVEQAPVKLIDLIGDKFFEKPVIDTGIPEQELTSLLSTLGQGDLRKQYLSLPPRHRIVLKALAQHDSIKLLAYHLKLSPKTVENYCAQLREALKCYSKLELIALAKSWKSIGIFN